MNNDWIIPKTSTKFTVTAMKTAKSPHQDAWQHSTDPKCVPAEHKSTQISLVRHNQIRCKFIFGEEVCHVEKTYINTKPDLCRLFQCSKSFLRN
jgi:hypothetical protein